MAKRPVIVIHGPPPAVNEPLTARPNRRVAPSHAPIIRRDRGGSKMNWHPDRFAPAGFDGRMAACGQW